MLHYKLKDNSFYKLQFPITETKINQKDITQDIISLSITEKMGGMTQGTLQIYDPNHKYSRILRPGKRVLISWGYKKAYLALTEIQKIDVDEFKGRVERRGLICTIISPSGGGSSGGIVTYNCNFLAYTFRGRFNRTRSFNYITKKAVVALLLTEIGVPPSNQFINFQQMTDTVKGVYQAGQSNFKFLRDLANLYWDALFFINYTPLGVPTAAFISPASLGSMAYNQVVLGASGNANNLYFNAGANSNVINYKWKDSFGNSGMGDGVRVEEINGQVMFFRYHVADRKVITWKLNIKKIKKDLQEAGLDTKIVGKSKLLYDWLSVRDFQTLVDRHYFTAVTRTTAPQGFGYTIDANMLGNPLVMPSNKVNFKDGFPDSLQGNPLIKISTPAVPKPKFYIQSVIHKFGSDGYKMTLKIVDGLTLLGIGKPIT